MLFPSTGHAACLWPECGFTLHPHPKLNKYSKTYLPDMRTSSCSSGNISICETFLLSPMRDIPSEDNKHIMYSESLINSVPDKKGVSLQKPEKMFILPTTLN